MDQESSSYSPISFQRSLRTYETIWKQLKLHRECVVTVVHEGFVANIKRMVSKEKDMDKRWKRERNAPLFIYTKWKVETKELKFLLLDMDSLCELRSRDRRNKLLQEIGSEGLKE